MNKKVHGPLSNYCRSSLCSKSCVNVYVAGSESVGATTEYSRFGSSQRTRHSFSMQTWKLDGSEETGPYNDILGYRTDASRTRASGVLCMLPWFCRRGSSGDGIQIVFWLGCVMFQNQFRWTSITIPCMLGLVYKMLFKALWEMTIHAGITLGYNQLVFLQ